MPGVVARDLWSIATAERVGQLRQVASGGQISVRFVPSESIPSAGFTTIAGEGNVITGAAIQMARFPDDVSTDRTRAATAGDAADREHARPRDLVTPWASSCIRPTTSDLMNENGNFLPGRDDERDPRSFITTADRNTMLHAYCR